MRAEEEPGSNGKGRTKSRVVSTVDRRMPRPVVAVAVIAAGLGTAWAMWATGLEGPRMSWQEGAEAVNQVWGQPVAGVVPAAVGGAATGYPMPTYGAAYANGPGGGFPGPAAVPTVSPVAAPAASFAIPYAASQPHPDRGVCTSCHAVTTPQGTPVPPIYSFSTMPHTYRGVCGNCHRLAVASASAGVAGAP